MWFLYLFSCFSLRVPLYWVIDTLSLADWNKDFVNVIGYTCAFPTATSQIRIYKMYMHMLLTLHIYTEVNTSHSNSDSQVKCWIVCNSCPTLTG